MGEGGFELCIQRQNLGQRAVAVNALAQRLGVERELSVHVETLIAQRFLQRNLTGCKHAQTHACNQDKQSPKQAMSYKAHEITV